MKNSSTAIIATLSAIGGSLLTLLVQSPPSHPNLDNEAKIVQLQQHIRQLEQERRPAGVASVQPAPQAEAHKIVVPTATAVAQPTTAINAATVAAAAESLHKNERFNNWLQKELATSPMFNLSTEMQKRFDAEAVDTYWAAAEEEKLRTLFSNNTVFSGSALKDAQCRTSQCQLSIGITDIEQANELVTKVSSALQADNPDITVIATPDPQRGVTTLYLSKNSDSFQFN